MKRLLSYLLVLAVFGICIGLTIQQGRKLAAPTAPASNIDPRPPGADGASAGQSASSLTGNLRENVRDPLSRLFIQVILIVLVARCCGALAVKIRQSAVIGEMILGLDEAVHRKRVAQS